MSTIVADEMVRAVQQAIHDLLVIKGRLPLLQAVAQELDRLDPGETLRVRNDAVLRLVRDSFDMLVVDLWSLREGVTGRRGMFSKLRDNLCGFRPKPIADSGASRSPIPVQGDHRFRSKPIAERIAR